MFLVHILSKHSSMPTLEQSCKLPNTTEQMDSAVTNDALVKDNNDDAVAAKRLKLTDSSCDN